MTRVRYLDSWLGLDHADDVEHQDEQRDQEGDAEDDHQPEHEGQVGVDVLQVGHAGWVKPSSTMMPLGITK